MLGPYVLKAVTQPRQRLGITENALPVPLILSGAVFLLNGILSAVMTWVLVHALMLVVCWMEPYCIQVLRARLAYPQTRRQVKAGGSVYGA